MIEGISQIDNSSKINILEDEGSESKGNRKMSREKVLNIVLLVFVFVLIGLFAYMFFTDRLIVGVENPFSKKEVPTSEEEEIPTSENEDVPLVSFTNTSLWPYRLKYPQDWEITKANTTCGYDSVNNQTVCTFHELEISYMENPEYAFYLSNCGQCGGETSLCGYSDITYSKELLNGPGIYIYYEDFQEINQGTFRRSFNPKDQESSDYDIRICERVDSQQSGVYYVWGGITAGSVAYKTPDNPDESILKVMDDILLSIEELHD